MTTDLPDHCVSVMLSTCAKAAPAASGHCLPARLHAGPLQRPGPHLPHAHQYIVDRLVGCAVVPVGGPPVCVPPCLSVLGPWERGCRTGGGREALHSPGEVRSPSLTCGSAVEMRSPS